MPETPLPEAKPPVLISPADFTRLKSAQAACQFSGPQAQAAQAIHEANTELLKMVQELLSRTYGLKPGDAVQPAPSAQVT